LRSDTNMRFDRLEVRQTEGDVRIQTEVAAVVGAVDRLRDVLALAGRTPVVVRPRRGGAAEMERVEQKEIRRSGSRKRIRAGDRCA